MKNKKASDIKWSASVKMNNGGFINKFAEGGDPPCGAGEMLDPVTNKCKAVPQGIFKNNTPAGDPGSPGTIDSWGGTRAAMNPNIPSFANPGASLKQMMGLDITNDRRYSDEDVLSVEESEEAYKETLSKEELKNYNERRNYQQALIKEPQYFDEAMTYHKGWLDSPMYKQMVLKSYNGQQKNADYLTKLRKLNLATIPPLNILATHPEGAENYAAWSHRDTGLIESFPSGFGWGPTMYGHEISHSTDRPRELYKWDHPSYLVQPEDKNDSPYNNYPDWMVYVDKRFPDETKWFDRVMPISDQKYITDHRAANWKDNPKYKENLEYYTPKTDEELKQEVIDYFRNYYDPHTDNITSELWEIDPKDPLFTETFNEFKKQNVKDVKYYKDYYKNEWKSYGHDYVSDPTETRARLHEIRMHAKKNGIYDPYTEQITPEIFQNYINKEWDDSVPMGPIDDLRHEFTDEEILHMLQNISKNKDVKEKEEIGAEGKAKNGGFIKWSASVKMNNGGFTKFVDGGDPGDRFKKRLMKKYPGMQGVYGSKGENLNIIKDPNYAASDYGFGDIEFIQPGSGHVQYSDDYDYQSPTPDKYTVVYNPKGANKHDVFLDTMHGMRDDPDYMKLLDKFSNETKKARGEDMDYWYGVDSKKDPYLVEDGREQWDKNFIDGVLRSHLAKKGMGRHSSDIKGYKMERQGSTPEMYKTTDDIYKYLKGKFQNGGPIKWSANTKMANGGFTKFAEGGSEVAKPCPEGQIFDSELNRCVDNMAYAFNNAIVNKTSNSILNNSIPIKVNEKYRQSYNWLKAYYASPMYKSMLYNSTTLKGDPSYDFVFNTRNKNLESAPPLKILPQPAGRPNVGGSSNNATGQIKIFPIGLGSLGTDIHELSHTSDRPVPNTRSGRIMPAADKIYIDKHKAKTLGDSREYHNDKEYYDSEKKYDPANYKEMEAGFKHFTVDYVGEDTETRARLNAIRKIAGEAGLYDPFTEKVTPDTYYKKIKNFKFHNKGKEGFDPMRQLKKAFSDEEIINMLNNISKNKKMQEKEEIGAESQAKNGGPIKWSANTKMANGGFINKFVAGGKPPCGPGEEVDTKTGLCIMSINLPEVDIYSKKSTRKLQGNLMEQIQQIRRAYHNSAARNQIDGDQWLYDLDMGPETIDIHEMPGRIARYKKAIEQEKIRYARDTQIFNQLKKFDPLVWDIQDRPKYPRSPFGQNSEGSLREKKHQSQARSWEGIETFRQALRDDKLSYENFMYAYNDWGKHLDRNAVQGTGPGAVYNNNEAKRKWGPNMKKENFKGLAYGITGALGAVGLGLAAPLIPLIGSGLAAVGSGISSVGTAIAPTYGAFMGTTASQIPGFSALAGTAADVSVGNYLAMNQMYKAGKGLIDGSIYDANKQVITDVTNGEFKPKNILNAVGKDLNLVTNFSKIMPIKDLHLDKTKAIVNVGQTVTDPTKFDPVYFSKGLVSAGKHKYGGVVNNILKKYPNFNIHNNALNNYLNGGSVT